MPVERLRRDAVALRLEADQPRRRGRDPNRAGAVSARRRRAQAGCDRGRTAAARPSRSPVGVPRVAGDPERRSLRRAHDGQLGQIGLAEHHGAGRPQARDEVVVARRRAAVGGGPQGGHLAADVLGVLDGDRDAQQRPVVARAAAGVGLRGVHQRPLVEHRAEGVQLGVEPPDAVEVQLDQLARGNLPAPDHLRLPARAGEGEVVALHGGNLSGPLDRAAEICKTGTARAAQTDPMSPDLPAARSFMATHGRLLDRRRLELLLDGGDPAPVLGALEGYRNPDGGYGFGLEPDLRAPESQIGGAYHAFEVLAEIGPATTPRAGELCDWLASVTLPAGGLPFALPVADPAGCAPFWANADPDRTVAPAERVRRGQRPPHRRARSRRRRTPLASARDRLLPRRDRGARRCAVRDRAERLDPVTGRRARDPARGRRAARPAGRLHPARRARPRDAGRRGRGAAQRSTSPPTPAAPHASCSPPR